MGETLQSLSELVAMRRRNLIPKSRKIDMQSPSLEESRDVSNRLPTSTIGAIKCENCLEYRVTDLLEGSELGLGENVLETT